MQCICQLLAVIAGNELEEAGMSGVISKCWSWVAAACAGVCGRTLWGRRV